MTLKHLFAQLASEFHANPRLRLGVFLIVPILLIYMLLVLADYRVSLLDDYRTQTSNLNKFKALANEKEWVERATQARSLLAQAESRLWTSESQGLAKADAQAWLEQIASSLNIDELRITAAEEVGVLDDTLWIVEANVQGRFDPKAYTRLIGQIEASPKSATVIAADFGREALPFFRLRVRFYFQAI